MTTQPIRKGDIFIADLKESYQYIMKGKHPVIVLSNWKACNKSPILNVVPITSKDKLSIPAHVKLGTECGLDMDSTALCEQLLTISRENLLFQIGKCTLDKMIEIKRAIDSQLGFITEYRLDVFEEVKKLLDNIEELDRYLRQKPSTEILKEKELAIKCLERYCINHSITLDISKYTTRMVREDNVKAI